MLIFMGPRVHVPWIIYTVPGKRRLTVNKMTLNISGCAVIQRHISIRWHGRLVPDVVLFDHGNVINLPHVISPHLHTWYDDARGHSTSGQKCTSLNHLKNVLSCVNRSYHLHFRPQSNTWKAVSITQCLVNPSKNTSRRNPSVRKTPFVFFNSSTCIAVAKPIHKLLSQYPTCENTKGTFATPLKWLTLTQAQFTLHSSLKYISTLVRRINCAGCSIWYRKKAHYSLTIISVNFQIWI